MLTYLCWIQVIIAMHVFTKNVWYKSINMKPKKEQEVWSPKIQVYALGSPGTSFLS